MKFYYLLFKILLTFSLLGCGESFDFYVGTHLQPDIDDDAFTPGMNIFGIIRPDYTDSINKSFIHIQKVVKQ